jgi:hypothetical protein
MEAGSHSGICTFGAAISWHYCLVSFLCVCYYYNILLHYSIITLQTHKKSLRIQQHPASAFTAAIKNSTRTGQAQASTTSQANTTQHYSTHSSVGTRISARKLAPVDLANMPTDARYAKKFPLYRPTLSSRYLSIYLFV